MVILGCTGSIGVNTLKIAKAYDLLVEVMVAGNNIALLREQLKAFSPEIVVVKEREDREKIDHPCVLWGEEGILEAIERSNSKLVVNALVGFAGLKPTLKAIKCGKRVALANKESLVVAGSFIDISKITPIDSEHFGLWYLLQEGRMISKMQITASGGSFRDTPLDALQRVTVEQALNHPNWSMGKKITIDSATMVNKLFELLEAKWLFDIEELDAVIETKSIIHALIYFADGSATAHFAEADMRLPIAFALLGKVHDQIVKPVDLVALGSLEFRPILEDRYPIWAIRKTLLSKPHLGAVLNSANEVAVAKFLGGEIGFLDIAKINLGALETFDDFIPNDLEDIYRIDQEIRKFLKD